MTKIPDFDPYDTLLNAVKQLEHLAESHRNLTQLVKESTELQKQLVQRVNEQTIAINRQHEMILELHGRIRLLETVRQYEQENTNTNPGHISDNH